MPAILLFAGTKNSCPGTRMARSYAKSTDYFDEFTRQPHPRLS
jgi:hypothetical protein